MPSQTKENYLKAMHALADEEGNVQLSDLSRELGVSNPTANSMIKKLQENGWVVYEKYKPPQLTAEGRKAAALIIRKHRITEMFLVEKMNFGWEEVHDIAEEMEHINSEALFERMDEMLGNPSVDPHGSPIPDKSGVMPPMTYQRLSEVEAGRRVRLCALDHATTDLLLLLNSKHIRLGTELTVMNVEPFDKSLTVAYDDFAEVMLSRAVGERLLVEGV